MAKFTIKDLAEGKCAVKNDGTLEELNRVLKVAFPNGRQSYGDANFYFKYGNKEWIGVNYIVGTFQSVKDFLEELESPKLLKRGDRILVSIDGHYWETSIFLTYIEYAKDPIICVAKDDEELFKHGDKFGICEWSNWKPIPELEVTLEDVAKKFKVDRIKIVEKKG